jgi:hypothetical protein
VQYPELNDLCVCGHQRDEHWLNGGQCSEEGCDCVSFTLDEPFCEFEGKYKVIYNDGDNTSKLYCLGHAKDWERQFKGVIIQPKKLYEDNLKCKGDWVLPGMVP